MNTLSWGAFFLLVAVCLVFLLRLPWDRLFAPVFDLVFRAILFFGLSAVLRVLDFVPAHLLFLDPAIGARVVSYGYTDIFIMEASKR